MLNRWVSRTEEQVNSRMGCPFLLPATRQVQDMHAGHQFPLTKQHRTKSRGLKSAVVRQLSETEHIERRRRGKSRRFH